MRPLKAPMFGLKFRLTMMMALLLALTLSIDYALNWEAEELVLAQVERQVLELGEKFEGMLADREEAAAKERNSRALPRASRASRDLFRRLPSGLEAIMQFHQAMLREMDREWERLQWSGRRIPVLNMKVIRGSKNFPRIQMIQLGAAPKNKAAERQVSLSAAPPPPAPEPEIVVLLEPYHDLFRDLRSRNLAILLGVFCLGIVISLAMATRITSPIQRMKSAFGRVAAGDLSETDVPRRKDEIGQMGESFRVMVGKLKENRDLEKRMFEQERFSTLGHLAAGVAHDVRNPLNAIGLTVDHIQDEYCPEAPTDRESFLRFTAAIRGEIARLNSLVNSFLSLAKPPSLDVKPHDLNEIVVNLLELVRSEAESRQVSISTDLERDLPDILLDGERIRAAIMNVVLNALQSMEGGGNLLVRTVRVGGEVHLIVKDTGRGIAPKDLERVFLPYYTTREEGTGLGLSVSRATVEGHDGRIGLSSKQGFGTTVTVALPLRGPDSKS